MDALLCRVATCSRATLLTPCKCAAILPHSNLSSVKAHSLRLGNHQLINPAGPHDV